MTPRLVDTVLADAFRDGLDKERRELHTTPPRYRNDVLQRMRLWETEIDDFAAQIENLRGRMVADNQWLNQHPEGGS